jgi:hypothetical protein
MLDLKQAETISMENTRVKALVILPEAISLQVTNAPLQSQQR